MLTRSPPPARSWSRKTSVAVIAPSRLVSTMRRCSSRWSEAKGAVSMTPALLTRMSAPPSSCCTRSAAVRPRPPERLGKCPVIQAASRPSENGFPDASGRRRSTASVAARPAGSWPSFPRATALVRPHGDLDSVAGIELAHEAGEVRFHGAEADVQLVGDLVVGAPMGHGDEDLLFP